MLDLDLMQLPLYALYAEIHFRFFPLFPSLLFRKEPEIVFDLPRRIEPNQDLPIFLIVNDIDRFSATIAKIEITLVQDPGHCDTLEFTPENHIVKHQFMQQMQVFHINIPRNTLPNGEIKIEAKAELKLRNGKRKWIFNDNLPTTSKQSFTCNISSESLPGSNQCIYADLHTHSQYSQSHVEFGPPVPVIAAAAKSYGLKCIGITDHSYDLACLPENYLKEDHQIRRWSMLRNELINSKIQDIAVILGEEVSCLNNMGKVVHLGALGIKDYLPGSLDGARSKRIHTTQLSINQAVEEIHKQGGVAFAAHPGAQSGFLQSLLLRRGIWSFFDAARSNIDGFQAANSGFSASWSRGKSLWLKLLQQGVQIPLYAGNDAHGDLNRYRAISKPFLKINEGFNRHLGYARTGIYTDQITQSDLIHALRSGKTFITNGPFIGLKDSSGANIISNQPLTPDTNVIILYATSTSEYGKILNIKVLQWDSSLSHEKIIAEFTPGSLDFSEQVLIKYGDRKGYIRAEVISRQKGNLEYVAFTSPCYLGKWSDGVMRRLESVRALER